MSTPGWCWICEQHREAPMVCSATCMESDYPTADEEKS